MKYATPKARHPKLSFAPLRARRPALSKDWGHQQSFVCKDGPLAKVTIKLRTGSTLVVKIRSQVGHYVGSTWCAA